MERTLQVSQLNRIIKDIIDNQVVLEHIRVVGEISSFSTTRGTAYFVIKDNESMLNCVMFGCSSEFNVGDNVVVEGSVKYYSKGAKISLNVYKISVAGQGELYQQFLIMKQKLESEGLFDEKFKKPIPNYIKRVGVITSKTGAVIQDIINTRNRRNPTLDIVLFDVQVQGVLAKQQIVEAINFFSEYEAIDCLIVARGGGSLEDLQPFNEEEVARAVFNCKKPVISAVGHETDFTIIDFVADLRAPTPTAASEIVSFDIFELKNTIHYYQTHLDKAIENAVMKKVLQLSNFEKKINLWAQDYFSGLKLKLNNFVGNLNHRIEMILKNKEHKLANSLQLLDSFNPAKILSKGYNIVKKQGKFCKNFDNLNPKDEISVENSTELLVCEIKEKLTK